MDRPGKDTYRHREAGAHEVLVATARRWALLHEVDGPEPALPALLARMAPVDLVLVEGFKTHEFAKSRGVSPRARQAADLAGLAGCRRRGQRCGPVATAPRPVLALDDAVAIAHWIGAIRRLALSRRHESSRQAQHHLRRLRLALES